MIAAAQTIVTNTIICGLCGGAGHITSDCKVKRDQLANGSSDNSNDASDHVATWHEREKMDSEYHSLMAELGQGEASKLSGPGKCIISRNGGPATTATLAIETGSSPTSSEPPTKVIDMTNLSKAKPPSLMSMNAPYPGADAAGQPPQYQSSHHQLQQQQTASAQYPYYPGMPYMHPMQMWPGQPMYPGYGWPPMPPGMAAPPPPPPPPPPPSSWEKEVIGLDWIKKNQQKKLNYMFALFFFCRINVNLVFSSCLFWLIHFLVWYAVYYIHILLFNNFVKNKLNEKTKGILTC